MTIAFSLAMIDRAALRATAIDRFRLTLFSLANLLLLVAASPAPANAQVPFVSPEIVETFPHDDAAFTQGLSIVDGRVLESTGRYGESSLRLVELETGEVLQRIDLPEWIFGEGSVRVDDQIFVLSWRAQTGFIYDAESFEEVGQFTYPGQGWGLTSDGQSLILSDGSPTLRFLDPEDMTLTRRLVVTYGGRPLRNLNELEWIDGAIWANVWMTQQIVMIDPANGAVTQVLDLAHAVPETLRGDRDAVLNGIAWDQETDRIFVTGKLWPVLHEIRLPTEEAEQALDP